MNFEEKVKKHFEKTDFIITKRILQRLEQLYEMKSATVPGISVQDILAGENVREFVQSRQPNLKPIDDSVIENITKYFRKNMESFNVISVFRSSNKMDEDNIYSVIGEKNNSYSCWSSWNDTRKVLNLGHYNVGDKENALRILRENFYDITDQPELYGIEQSERVVENVYCANEYISAHR